MTYGNMVLTISLVALAASPATAGLIPLESR